MIANRVSHLSCSEQLFKNEAPVYQDALKEAGYTDKIEYNIPEITDNIGRRKNIRSRKIIWFNPPFSQSVKTNIGDTILSPCG